MKKLHVMKYGWGRYTNYLGLMPFKYIPDFVIVDTDQSMNRVVDQERVDDIIAHIKQKADNLFFPPVILNSESGVNYDQENDEIAFKPQNKVRIIDGQHRLTAIKNIMTKLEHNNFKNRVAELEIPFVLIESLEPEVHRILFNEINQNAEKVDSVVSERFNISLRNLIGLRYISENLAYKSLIEWEEAQSDRKIVYLHLVKCIDKLIKELPRILKKKNMQMFSEPHHRDESYFNIHKMFLDTWFTHLSTVGGSEEKLKFWVKLVVIATVTDDLILTLRNQELDLDSGNELLLNAIKTTIESSLNAMLPNKLYYKYNGNTTQTKKTYDSIRKYISINKYLEDSGLGETDSEKGKQLVGTSVALMFSESS